MIVGQGSDVGAKLAQMLAQQQQPQPQQGMIPPYIFQGTGTAGLNSYNPPQGYQPPMPDDTWTDPGIYGPTSIIGKEYAAQQQQPQPQQQQPPGPDYQSPQMSDSGGFYGPTSQMAKDMQKLGYGPPSEEPNPMNMGNQQFQQQNIDYYKQALANMLQQLQQGGGYSAGMG